MTGRSEREREGDGPKESESADEEERGVKGRLRRDGDCTNDISSTIAPSMISRGRLIFLPRQCSLVMHRRMSQNFCLGIVNVPYWLSLTDHTGCKSNCSIKWSINRNILLTNLPVRSIPTNNWSIKRTDRLTRCSIKRTRLYNSYLVAPSYFKILDHFFHYCSILASVANTR